MARRYKPQPRTVKPDPRYGSKQVSMFVNRMMKDGKKVKIPGFSGELSGKNGYSSNFLTYTYDFNSDGWKDVLVFG